MGTLLTIHGEIRWLVAIIAIIAIARYIFGLVRNQPYTANDRRLMSGFVGVMDINLILGLILLFGLGGGLTASRLEHAVTMIIAIAVGHSSAMWRRRDDSALKFRNNIIVIVAAMLLVVIGVVRLRGGWTFG